MVFSCSVRLASGRDTAVIIVVQIKDYAFKISIDVVFGIVTAVVIVIVVVVVNSESPTLSGLTLSPVVRIIIVGVIDKAKGPIIVGVRGLNTTVDTVIV